MIDYSQVLQTETSPSSSAFTAKFGFCLWQWSGKEWTAVEDKSVAGGVCQQPSHAGRFVGQLRSVASRAGDECHGK